MNDIRLKSAEEAIRDLVESAANALDDLAYGEDMGSAVGTIGRNFEGLLDALGYEKTPGVQGYQKRH